MSTSTCENDTSGSLQNETSFYKGPLDMGQESGTVRTANVGHAENGNSLILTFKCPLEVRTKA